MTRQPSDIGHAGSARRDPLAFDRYDRWGLVFLLGAVSVGVVVAHVVDPVVAWVRSEPMATGVISAVTVPQLDAVGVGYGSASYDLTVLDPTAGQRVLDLLPGVLLAVLVVLACWCIVLLLRTVGSGDPFDPVNVTRLRIVAAALVVGVPTVHVLRAFTDSVVLGDLDLGGLDLSFWVDVPWVPMLAGMVVAMLAEAFKAGSRLRDDVDGLV